MGKKLFIILCMALTLISSAFAQSEELKPGITPDSPFYFLDTMFDGLQSSESRANEKAGEIIAMAQENKLKALEKAKERYEKAMEKRNRVAQESEEDAEEVTRQASMHFEALSKVYEQVPQQAKLAIEAAMQKSADGREEALEQLSEFNPQKGAQVAQETLAQIMVNAPVQASEGLQRALDSIGSNASSAPAGENNTQRRIPPVEVTDTETEIEQDVQEQRPNASSGATTGSAASGQGDFRLLVSDAPANIADFEYVLVHLTKTRIFKGEGNESSFEQREINVTVDLTQLVGELSTEVLSAELASGVYSKIELYVDAVEAKTINNETANVMVPSEKLQIVKSFTIVQGEVTTFVFDINVVKKGLGNEYNLLPVISESGVVGEDLAEDEVEEVENEVEDVELDEAECTLDADCAEGQTCVNEECELVE
jgi:hypothetical protein